MSQDTDHVSVLCRCQQDRPHRPCSGTCDGHGSGQPCNAPCACRCHGRAPSLTQRRILETVRAAPGGGIHRAELELELGASWAQIWPAARGIYGRRLIDFCGPYMVAPPRPRSSAPAQRSADEERAPARPTGDAGPPQLRLVPSVRKLAAELELEGGRP